MVKLIKWFDRKFDFNFPVSLYSTIVARVAGTPARVEEIDNIFFAAEHDDHHIAIIRRIIHKN